MFSSKNWFGVTEPHWRSDDFSAPLYPQRDVSQSLGRYQICFEDSLERVIRESLSECIKTEKSKNQDERSCEMVTLSEQSLPLGAVVDTLETRNTSENTQFGTLWWLAKTLVIRWTKFYTAFAWTRRQNCSKSQSVWLQIKQSKGSRKTSTDQ